ncbi:MAG: cadmium-translocating P-type ATPase [Pseudomonadales bacterium]|nr:cadmium-translocating P-type ATPase [Pseudomonadales bacterium]
MSLQPTPPQAPPLESACYHCGLPTPNNVQHFVTILGVARPMCCPGCEAVASNIVDLGMENYYKHRTPSNEESHAGEVIPDFLKQNAIWNQPELQGRFVRTVTDATTIDKTKTNIQPPSSHLAITLMISGITCAACIWLIEKQLQKLTGVTQCRVNLSSHLAEVEWNPKHQTLNDILFAIHKVGYQAEPYCPQKQENLLQQENKTALARIGVAALGAMQVMMFAGGLYLGAFQGIAVEHEQFLRWVSAIVCVPVYLYSGYPFLASAARNIKSRHAGMDIPVSIAITAAFFASLWSTFTHGPEVYFDSVCMFVLFLSIGRYLEMRARHRSLATTIRIAHRTTLMAHVEDNQGSLHTILADQLKPGDNVLVKAGETIPGDGCIVKGSTNINESMLTGEERPITKSEGQTVTGGTINITQPIHITIEHQPKDSVLSALQLLLEKAQSHKPKVTMLADNISRYFVIAVLLISSIVFGAWYIIEPSMAFWVTLSVLVVTCPCALSLATPAAITSSASALANHGFLANNSRFSEALNNISDIVFDKTGTLTCGIFSVSECYLYPNSNISTDEATTIAVNLESHSEHPIAKAFCQNKNNNPLEMSNIHIQNNQGICGKYNHSTYRIGSYTYAAQSNSQPQSEPMNNQWVWLSKDSLLLARFKVEDTIREDCPALIQFLQHQGYQLHILSGDSSNHPASVGDQLGITHVISNASPNDKLNSIQALQKQGKKVLMVGDGLNDAPVLAAANCSISMSNGTDLAKSAADGLLINPNISTLINVFITIKKTYRIIKQNLIWALLYNTCALPAAIVGWIPPWLAAIGMSTSSLFVVLNALRIQSTPSQPSYWNQA